MADPHEHRTPEGGRREFGRDGISGMVTPDRAVRAREVSRPSAADLEAAEQAAAAMVARARGRR